MQQTVQEALCQTEAPEETDKFYQDVIEGLTSEFKRLPSKYFYDQQGDRIFQQIMACDQYYLTRCEAEILKNQREQICETIRDGDDSFEIIELGAGDGTKTVHLLDGLARRGKSFRYLPIDISGNILNELTDNLLAQNPELDIEPLEGEYFEMLDQAVSLSALHKVVMFLGSNIGNMPPEDALQFCTRIRQSIMPGDMVLIGFDLVKDPYTIRAAYSDEQGITNAFNLNLLKRINTELGADFNLNLFDHYCSYDPLTGACKSYLVSQRKHTVSFPSAQIHFNEGECIWMEISQKYSLSQISQMALNSGFEPISTFTDSKGWFADVVWKAV
ncbi:dimethylhistidine N-methyltransferase [Dyadobacter endophyticus]|uniref:Dimethylhistidine N-methyltransferase n=1 Tax=Dyadobacter endophyticus TaxID=1749036 RepID=A0ABQ1YG03_9BACT|nr:L-histidine N(alpha)-methyltransferase [Dyadobacter endophyticus]GGH24828.1 dimethylhistidine N-methyltransferase [Dyadobacter endophyticus]